MIGETDRKREDRKRRISGGYVFSDVQRPNVPPESRSWAPSDWRNPPRWSRADFKFSLVYVFAWDFKTYNNVIFCRLLAKSHDPFVWQFCYAEACQLNAPKRISNTSFPSFLRSFAHTSLSSSSSARKNLNSDKTTKRWLVLNLRLRRDSFW